MAGNGQKERTIMLDIKDFLAALDTSVKQFPDRSAKWLLENTENLRGLLEIIASDIVAYLDFSRSSRLCFTLGNRNGRFFPRCRR